MPDFDPAALFITTSFNLQAQLQAMLPPLVVALGQDFPKAPAWQIQLQLATNLIGTARDIAMGIDPADVHGTDIWEQLLIAMVTHHQGECALCQGQKL